MKTLSSLSPFARAYIECALWSSTRDDGIPLDRDNSIDDIDSETLTTMAREADKFALENAADIKLAHLSDKQAGHCFWLNRNGHGSQRPWLRVLGSIFFSRATQRRSLLALEQCVRRGRLA
jgi:hypothetical protein